METSVSVEVNAPKEEVWKAITDFENCQTYISAINNLEILHQPEDTLIGFKWKESRTMFGKEAVETMWITECEENSYNQTRAESHGSIYISRMAVESLGDKTKLSFSFKGEAVSFFAKIMMKLMSGMMKKSMDEAMCTDLDDIKAYVEANYQPSTAS
ncbi:MAG: SRPBCC family protein [Balneolaceae bacterium]|nr:SRPBCC family protein [Balneolaceae bacterium]